MTFVAAIEGIDGSGKGTTTRGVKARLEAAGLSVATLSFPNYGKTAAARAIVEVLNGAVKVDDAYYLAGLFALDRAETFIAEPLPDVDVVIFDRYTLSNAAFQMVRLPHDQREGFLEWLFDFEYRRLGTPEPDLNILMRIAPETATALVARKAARDYTDRTRDAFEADAGYQRRVAEAYAAIAARQLNGPWSVVEVADLSAGDAALKPPEAVAGEVEALIRKGLIQKGATGRTDPAHG